MDVAVGYYNSHKNVLVDGTESSDNGVCRAGKMSYHVSDKHNGVQSILKGKVGCAPFLAVLDVGLVRIVYKKYGKGEEGLVGNRKHHIHAAIDATCLN